MSIARRPSYLLVIVVAAAAAACGSGALEWIGGIAFP